MKKSTLFIIYAAMLVQTVLGHYDILLINWIWWPIVLASMTLSVFAYHMCKNDE